MRRMQRRENRKSSNLWTAGYTPPRNNSSPIINKQNKKFSKEDSDKEKTAIGLFGMLLSIILFIIFIKSGNSGPLNFIPLILFLISAAILPDHRTPEEKREALRKLEERNEINRIARMEVRAFSEALHDDSLKYKPMYDIIRKNLLDKK